MARAPHRGAEARVALGLACCAAIAACTDVGLFRAEPSGKSPPVEGPPPSQTGPIFVQTQVAEDFNSRLYVDSSSVAEIDVNQGIATLPAETFPDLTSSTANTLPGMSEVNGVIAGSSVLLPPDGEIRSSDSVEIRAGDIAHLSGHIRAGQGGVTVIAQNGIVVDGIIESEGPVRFKLASEAGSIEISGAVMTLPAQGQSSASISLLSRGPINIPGHLETGSSDQGDSGGIQIQGYGDIVISGLSASLFTGDAPAGHAGAIDLSTESEIDVGEAAILMTGSTARDDTGRIPTAGGDIILRSERMSLASYVQLRAGDAPSGTGGAIRLTVEDHLEVGHSAILAAGAGDGGGTIALDTRTASVGDSLWTGGDGVSLSGTVFFEAAGNVVFDTGAALAGGLGRCGPGGNVVVLVGGRIAFADGVMIRGGSGDNSGSNDCVGSRAGGTVQVVAQDISGDPNQALIKGPGAPSGTVSLTRDPSFTRPMPTIRVRTLGWIVSKIFDRGSATSRMPILVSARIDTPAGTFAKIQLAGSNDAYGKYSEWTDLGSDSPLMNSSPVIGARFLRYRLWMKGRALDAPKVDYFDINFAP